MGEGGRVVDEISVLRRMMYGAAISLTDLEGGFDMNEVTEKAFVWVMNYDPSKLPSSQVPDKDTIEVIESYKRNPVKLLSDINAARHDMLYKNLALPKPGDPDRYLAVCGEIYDGVFLVGSGFAPQALRN